ncbi:MAG: hypothetical protein ISR80_05410 [Nitrosopumilus sp.]|nr:hypothetical protein [Nitrosopumilus sp.]
MGDPFAINHKKAGYLICVLIPFGWLVIIGQMEMIRKSLRVIIPLIILNYVGGAIAGSMLESSDGIIVLVGMIILIVVLVAYYWIFWTYYTTWIEQWKIKNQQTS